MLAFFRKRTLRTLIGVLLWCGWSGVYPCWYEFFNTAEAGPFSTAAQSGQNFGDSLLSGAQTTASTGSSAFSSLGEQGPTGWTSQLKKYYIPGNTGLSGGTTLNNAAAAQGTLLQDTTCPTGWSTDFTPLTQSYLNYQSMVTTCNQRVGSFMTAARRQQASDPTLYYQAVAAVSGVGGWDATLTNTRSMLSGIIKSGNTAPSCDLENLNQMQAVGSLWSSSSTGFGSLQSYCASLPTTPSAQNLTAELTDIQSLTQNLGSMTINNASVKSLSSTISYAVSYQTSQSGMSNLNAYTSSTSAYGQMLNPSTFMGTTEGAALETSMMPLLTGNPNVFAQYYTPANCTVSTTYFSNTGTTEVTPPTTSVSAGGNPSNPVACNMSKSGWVTNFPDSSAAYIWGGTNSCTTVPTGTVTDTFETTYNNGGNGSTTGSNIAATAYLAIDDQGSMTIANTSTNSTQNIGYTDNNGSPITANPPDGWVSQPVTIYPGQNVITITDQDDAVAPTGSTTSDIPGAIASIVDNATGSVLIDTNTSQWNWVNAPTTAPVVTTATGATVSTSAPSASATSDICKNEAVRCLGTQCHGLIGNQNLSFSKAITATTALTQIESGAMCQTGTSVAAGNCIPILFQGNMNYCRNFPLSGALTNNCCAEGLKMASGTNVGAYIKIISNAWQITGMTMFRGSVVAMPHLWAESAYTKLSSVASSAWNYVSGPFVSAAESVMQCADQLGASVINFFSGGAVTSAAQLASTGASVAGKASSMFSYVSNLETTVTNELTKIAVKLISSVIKGVAQATGTSMTTAAASQIAKSIVSYASEFISVVMIIYLVYQIVSLVANLLTACKSEEYQLGQYRMEHDCQMVGTYCAQKVAILGCIVHKTTFCCYHSPLDRIIASQIRIGQPNVAGGYGATNNPDCNGFTVQQLAAVNWSQVSLSQWLAILEQSGLLQSTNQSAAAGYNQGIQDHPSGVVN